AVTFDFCSSASPASGSGTQPWFAPGQFQRRRAAPRQFSFPINLPAVGSIVILVIALTNANDLLIVSPRGTSTSPWSSQSPRRATIEYLPVGTSAVVCGVAASREI